MSNCRLCGGVIPEPRTMYPDYTNICRCLPLKSPTEILVSAGANWNPQVTPMSILELCEKMSLEEVKALIGLLTAYYDCAVLSAHPGGFKKRETDE